MINSPQYQHSPADILMDNVEENATFLLFVKIKLQLNQWDGKDDGWGWWLRMVVEDDGGRRSAFHQHNNFLTQSTVKCFYLVDAFFVRLLCSGCDPQTTTMSCIPTAAFSPWATSRTCSQRTKQAMHTHTACTYFLIPQTNNDAQGWCMLKHFPTRI